jgi:dienelactone hydrolase
VRGECNTPVGHSFGGWTVLATPEAESRVQAVVALGPGGSAHPRPGILPLKLTFDWGRDVPTLYLAAEHDTPIPLSRASTKRCGRCRSPVMPRGYRRRCGPSRT